MSSSPFTKKQKRLVNLTSFTEDFTSKLGEAQGISEITRKELIGKAEQNLAGYEAGNVTFGDFQNEAKSIASRLKEAQSGESREFETRKRIERKRAMRRDRPGMRQLMLSRRS